MREVKKLLVIAAAAAIIAVATAGEARAQGTDITTFNVTITITESCDIHTTAATDVNFNTHSRSAGTADAAGALSVNCTLDTNFQIALGDGAHHDGSTRRMSGGTSYVPYGLYQDASRTLVWGNMVGTNTLGGQGTGVAVSVPVYGRATSLNAPAGTYTDTVQATITY